MESNALRDMKQSPISVKTSPPSSPQPCHSATTNNNATTKKASIKVLKSTSNLNKSESSNSPIIISNSTPIGLLNQKSPQVSYRLINLNTSNSHSSSGSSNLLLMMPNTNNNNTSNHPNHQSVTFVKQKSDPFQKSIIDQKRRMTHKEIERRRRDKINDWIYALSKEVPDCAADRTKQGQSKGGILAKTVKYIQDIRAENFAIYKEKQDLCEQVERLKRQIDQLEQENCQLKTALAMVDNNNKTTTTTAHSKKK